MYVQERRLSGLIMLDENRSLHLGIKVYSMENKSSRHKKVRIMPNITQKMLTQPLRDLEADGLVPREVYNCFNYEQIHDILKP